MMSKGDNYRVMWSREYAENHNRIFNKHFHPLAESIEEKAQRQAIKDVILVEGKYICPGCGESFNNYKKAEDHEC